MTDDTQNVIKESKQSKSTPTHHARNQPNIKKTPIIHGLCLWFRFHGFTITNFNPYCRFLLFLWGFLQGLSSQTPIYH